VTTRFVPEETPVVPFAGDTAVTVGGVRSGPEGSTGVFMSAWISAAVKAWLYARMSSMRPLNHSLQTAFPPIRSGPVEVLIAPARLSEVARVPFTYIRKTAPS
jgi:hypothetical protein